MTEKTKMKTNTISWDRPMLERFKEAYNKAMDHSGSEIFHFEGNDFYTEYARYLIEYLEGQLS